MRAKRPNNSSAAVSDFLKKYGSLHPDITKDLLDLQQKLSQKTTSPIEYANFAMRAAEILERVFERFMS